MKRPIVACLTFFIGFSHLWAQEAGIAVFPETAYERFTIYENLIIFWIGIIGLVIIIKMKLREIERVQKLGIDREDKDIPLLD